jgi:hypothetical protein
MLLQVAAKAPLYFKKAVDDAESEWSQHHAKRWIDTSAKAGDPRSLEHPACVCQHVHTDSAGMLRQLIGVCTRTKFD